MRKGEKGRERERKGEKGREREKERKRESEKERKRDVVSYFVLIVVAVVLVYIPSVCI
jgi:hypothetical protein